MKSTVLWWCVTTVSYCRAGHPVSRVSEWEVWHVWWWQTSWGSNNWRNRYLYTPPAGRRRGNLSCLLSWNHVVSPKHIKNPKLYQRFIFKCLIKLRPSSWSPCLAPWQAPQAPVWLQTPGRRWCRTLWPTWPPARGCQTASRQSAPPSPVGELASPRSPGWRRSLLCAG